MQAVVETIASWFNFIGVLIGAVVDIALITVLGWFGVVLVFLKDLLKWGIEELWDASIEWTAEGLAGLLDQLGFEDVDVATIRSWLEMANYFIPVKEALAWFEAYWAFRLAKFTFKQFMWLNPFKGG